MLATFLQHLLHCMWLACLCFGLYPSVVLTASATATAPTVTYLSLSSSSYYSPQDAIISGNSMLSYLNATSHGDDSPLTRIDLPFPLNFFGSYIYHLYVNPNGALQTSSALPCLCNCFYDNINCNFNNAYYGVIAGYLSDLEPFAGGNSSGVFAEYSKSFVRIHFRGIPFFGSTQWSNTFAFTIHNDSRIDIDYLTIAPIQGVSNVMAGLRVPKDQSQIHTYFTSAQLSRSQSEWSTTVQGIYPPKSTVASGQRFSACPVSTSWCLHNKYIDVNKLSLAVVSNASYFLNLTALSAACLESIEITISFDSSPSALSPNPPMDSLNAPCKHMAGTTTIYCNLALVPLTSLKSSSTGGNVLRYISLFWKPTFTTQLRQGFGYIPIRSIPIVFFTNKSSNPSKQTCSSNALLPTACNECSICNGNFSCLDLSCIINGAPEPYQYPICGRNCSTVQVYNTATSTCCTINQQDCAGSCFGTARITKTNYGPLTCCTTFVDCHGICGGSAIRDACGVCGGSSFKIGGNYNCSQPLHIDTSHRDGNLYPVINVTPGLAHYNTTSIIILTNKLKSTIYMKLTAASQNDHSLDPVISLPFGQVSIRGLSSTMVPINVSLDRLVFGKAYGWQTKSFWLTYEASYGDANTARNLLLAMNIGVSECQSVASKMLCATYPGCIFCPKLVDQRILASSEDNEILSESRRKLFSDILPIAQTDVFDPDSYPGACVQGFRPENCSAYFSLGSRKYSSWLWMLVMIASSAILASLHVL